VESKPVKIANHHIPFSDPLPEEFGLPDLNVHLKQYFDFGPPIILGRNAIPYKGQWYKAFKKKAPLCLEIGSGNGFFLQGMAAKNPDKNWLGVEIRYKRVVLTAKKIKSSQVTNARIVRYDNWYLDDLFLENEIDSIFTNHPDPWSKKKQAKKRILSPAFAKWAAYVMKPGGEWRIKTDFEVHINTMLSIIEELPFEVLGVSRDAHRDGFPWPKEDDITTNYENKFIDKGLPIFALHLRRKI
jgi:tRNA (guanine-N7-)-methyltransferase